MKNALAVICLIISILCIVIGVYMACRILTSDLPLWFKYLLLK